MIYHSMRQPLEFIIVINICVTHHPLRREHIVWARLTHAPIPMIAYFIGCSIEVGYFYAAYMLFSRMHACMHAMQKFCDSRGIPHYGEKWHIKLHAIEMVIAVHLACRNICACWDYRITMQHRVGCSPTAYHNNWWRNFFAATIQI